MFRRLAGFVWLLLALCLLIAFVLLVYPIYVIRPFRYQGPHELALALRCCAFDRFSKSPWRSPDLPASPSGGPGARHAAQIGRCSLRTVGNRLRNSITVNVFELMFHPLERREFASVSEAKLDGDEQVIAD